jgi:hypothetical protein
MKSWPESQDPLLALGLGVLASLALLVLAVIFVFTLDVEVKDPWIDECSEFQPRAECIAMADRLNWFQRCKKVFGDQSYCTALYSRKDKQ